MNDLQHAVEAISSLEAQLVSLYAEKEQTDGIEEMRAAIASLEAQLCDLYASQEGGDGADQEAIRNLEAQVIGLTDEKMALEQKAAEMELEVQKLKAKARVMGAALFEAALFTSAPASL